MTIIYVTAFGDNFFVACTLKINIRVQEEVQNEESISKCLERVIERSR